VVKRHSADVRINDNFNFSEYLQLCFGEMLEELVEFKPVAWFFVIALAGLEAAGFYVGFKELALDVFFATISISLLASLWVVSKGFSKSVIRAAERSNLDFHSIVDRITREYHVEVHFLRMLQAVTFRNAFRVSVFICGQDLRSYISIDHYFEEHNGPGKVTIILLLACSTCLLPFISFDWGLAMFLPPHIDEDNVEVAELVCWRQQHPLQSFTAPWEKPVGDLAVPAVGTQE